MAENPSAALAAGLTGGDRRALARAITLVESTRSDHRAQAQALLEMLLPRTGKSVRLGISGVPGVGKSTFIEAFGLHLVGIGRRVAVLAVDPSSKRTGGSILGDKTRMADLGRHPRAFIRPSAAGSTLGGVARRTADAILLVEAAGYDTVLVETVGVGQSETAVSEMVDLFCLLLPPGGGDELQGLKKGIVELAELLVVNKADGDLAAAAGRAAADYHAAISLLRGGEAGWRPPVLRCSALTGAGIAEVWQAVEKHRAFMAQDGRLTRRRAAQARARMWDEIEESFREALTRDPRLAARLPALEADVAAGRTTPGIAARQLLTALGLI